MASPVTASQRTVYTATIGGKRRKFHTAGAAWYAIAKSALGAKYLEAMTMVTVDTPEVTDQDRARAARAERLFFAPQCVMGGDEHDYNCRGNCAGFNSKKWQAYVRRVARKLRALDGYREKVRRG